MKTTIIIGSALLWSLSLPAQLSVTASPNAFGNVTITGSNQSWINAENVSRSDDAHAIFNNITGGVGNYTDYLVATDFQFDIPIGTVISGIKVEVECSDPNSRTSDHSVRIVKTGAVTGDEKALGTGLPTSDNYMVYGGPTDLWGEGWDYKFVNDNNFGVAIAAKRNAAGGQTAGQIDHIRITLYYNLIVLPVTLMSFTATKENNSIRVKWRSELETGIGEYKVQRSADGRNFYPLASVTARNESISNYVHIDPNPLPGVSYYRLKIEGQSGYEKYSPVVSVSFNKENTVTLYPSPWKQGVDLNITNDNKEKLLVYFFSAGGQLLSTAVTESKLVPTTSLSNQKGVVSYKVYDTRKNLLGKGVILIQ